MDSLPAEPQGKPSKCKVRRLFALCLVDHFGDSVETLSLYPGICSGPARRLRGRGGERAAEPTWPQTPPGGGPLLLLFLSRQHLASSLDPTGPSHPALTVLSQPYLCPEMGWIARGSLGYHCNLYLLVSTYLKNTCV